jgi:hypothetical protein
MPCQSDYPDDRVPRVEYDQVVRLLCEANRLIDDRDELGYETHTPRSNELRRWWNTHRKLDAARLKGSK